MDVEMSKTQISLGFVRRRKEERFQEFKNGLKVGMLADDVLKLAREKIVRYTRRPEKIAESDHYFNQIGASATSIEFNYYRDNKIELPDRFGKREFAFVFFGGKGIQFMIVFNH